MTRKTKKIKFKCIICGKSKEMIQSRLNDRTGKYCSKKCADIGSRKSRIKLKCSFCGKDVFKLKSRIKLKCSFCGKDVFKLKSRIKPLNFCDNNCKKSYFKNNPPNKKNGFWFENGYKVLYNKGNHIKEHIFVIENNIGRKLKKNEVVHHINGIIDDNRLENLRLMTRAEHTSLHRNGK